MAAAGVQILLEDGREAVIFFTKKYSFSNLFHANFSMDISWNCHRGPIHFISSEQAYMAYKAAKFNDQVAFNDIMKATDQVQIKRLGGRVRCYKQSEWSAVKESIMFQCLLEKFGQNDYLRRQLLATGNSILIEASPHDCFWGIGLPMDHPNVVSPRLWRGQNRLGAVLAQVRETLLAENNYLMPPFPKKRKTVPKWLPAADVTVEPMRIVAVPAANVNDVLVALPIADDAGMPPAEVDAVPTEQVQINIEEEEVVIGSPESENMVEEEEKSGSVEHENIEENSEEEVKKNGSPEHEQIEEEGKVPIREGIEALEIEEKKEENNEGKEIPNDSEKNENEETEMVDVVTEMVDVVTEIVNVVTNSNEEEEKKGENEEEETLMEEESGWPNDAGKGNEEEKMEEDLVPKGNDNFAVEGKKDNSGKSPADNNGFSKGGFGKGLNPKGSRFGVEANRRQEYGFGNGGFTQVKATKRKAPEPEEPTAVWYIVCQVHPDFVIAARANADANVKWPYFMEIEDKCVRNELGDDGSRRLLIGDKVKVATCKHNEQFRNLAITQEEVTKHRRYWINPATGILPKQGTAQQLRAIELRTDWKPFVGIIVGLKAKNGKVIYAEVISCGLQCCSRFTERQLVSLKLDSLQEGQLVTVQMVTLPEHSVAEVNYVLPPNSTFRTGQEQEIDVAQNFGALAQVGPHTMKWPMYDEFTGRPKLFPCSPELTIAQLQCVEHVVAAGLGYEMELEVRKMLAARFEGSIIEHRPLRKYKLEFGSKRKLEVQLLTEVWESEANVKVRTSLAKPHFAQGTVGESEIEEIAPGLFVFSVWIKLDELQYRKRFNVEAAMAEFEGGSPAVVHVVPGNAMTGRLMCFKRNVPTSVAQNDTPQGRIMAALLGRSIEAGSRMEMADVDDLNDGVPEGGAMHDSLRRLNARQRKTAENILDVDGCLNHQQAPGGTGKTEVAAAALSVLMGRNPEDKIAMMACANIPITKLVQTVERFCGMDNLNSVGSISLFAGTAKAKYGQQIREVRQHGLAHKISSQEHFQDNLEKTDKDMVVKYLEMVENHPKFAPERGVFRIFEEVEHPKVVFCTSSLAEDLLDGPLRDVKVLIFDECTQASWAIIVNIVANMPLLKKILLTGDKHQLGVYLAELPPILQVGFGLESVLEQVEISPGVQYTFLTKCYRSHPAIVQCISAAKYEPAGEKLIPATPPGDRNLLTDSSFILPVQSVPIVLINSVGITRRDPKGTSICCNEHTEDALYLVDSLVNTFGDDVLNRTVILCMYLHQLDELDKFFHRRGEYAGLQMVSVDSYQSQESDIVILVTSRTSRSEPGLGVNADFFRDDRRACVALTRSRHALFIIGDLLLISTGPVWYRFIKKALEYTTVVTDHYGPALHRGEVRRFRQSLYGRHGTLEDQGFFAEWQWQMEPESSDSTRQFPLGGGHIPEQFRQDQEVEDPNVPGPSRPIGHANVVQQQDNMQEQRGQPQAQQREWRPSGRGNARGTYRGKARNQFVRK